MSTAKKLPMAEQLNCRRDKGKVWSHIRKKWVVETPEETVRQEYLCILVNEYGFTLDQMNEELEVTGRAGLPKWAPGLCSRARLSHPSQPLSPQHAGHELKGNRFTMRCGEMPR
jgi:Type I restriction enzyme R protein N terminus (HSDR_N)